MGINYRSWNPDKGEVVEKPQRSFYGIFPRTETNELHPDMSEQVRKQIRSRIVESNILEGKHKLFNQLLKLSQQQS